MGQQDFLKNNMQRISALFLKIFQTTVTYMKLSSCLYQQTQLSKDKMSCAEYYDDKRKKNYIFLKLNFWALKRSSPAVLVAENHQNISGTITQDQAS